jgi:hypothetical protein
MLNINDMKFTGKEVEDVWELKILRDQFAAAALTGLISETEAYAWHKIPTVAYELADLMLEARKEKKDGLS